MSGGLVETCLSSETLDIHRALASLQEELEAIDFYQQRQEGATDAALKAILIHNRDDEMEHAAMLMEWLRRTMPGFELQMTKLLFTTGDLTVLAKGVKAPEAKGSGQGLGNVT
jgi:hypothetical protein